MSINVDPEKQADRFYRYKMPRVQVKVEGNGNGIKSVIVNIEDIAQALRRNVEYPMKFFAHELAATSKFKDEKWILTGSFPQDKIQECLFNFIKKFVLCKSCRNPETVISVDSKKDIYMSCGACGDVHMVPPVERLCNLIIKLEKPVAVVSRKEDKLATEAEKKEKKEKEKKAKKSKTERDEEKFDREARAAKASDVIESDGIAKDELANPVDVLREFMNETPAPSDKDVAAKVFDLKNDYGLDDKGVVYLVFEALFDDDVAKQVTKKGKLMKRFLKPDTEKELIISLMLLCNDKDGLKSKFPMLLKKFYDADIISEDCIFTWHSGKSSKALDKDSQKYYKAKSEPFVEWLQEAEEEESEEESEDEAPAPSPKAPAAAAEGSKDAPDDDEDIDIDAI